MSMKNPLTPAGFETATFRFVAQHLNHCATAVPLMTSRCTNYSTQALGALKAFSIKRHSRISVPPPEIDIKGLETQFVELEFLLAIRAWLRKKNV